MESLFHKDAFIAIGTPEEVLAQWDAEVARRQRDALRATLAPLLDDPWQGDQDAGWFYCVFCKECVYSDDVDRGRAHRKHKSDCPVLRTDELLGR